jgi:RNA polymerase sigma-70 factor (ECF subfamily)
MVSGTDVSLVARRLFEQHGDAIYRFAVVLLRHHQDAEDVVQETFLKLLRHLGDGGNTDNVRGWLFTVAAHASRDRQRRRFRFLPWAADYDARVAPPELPDEDGRLAAARESLRRLAGRDRLLLALRAHDLSYRDIAAAAGIRQKSVGTLLARAVARWKEACDRSGQLGGAHGIKPERHQVL